MLDMRDFEETPRDLLPKVGCFIIEGSNAGGSQTLIPRLRITGLFAVKSLSSDWFTWFSL